MFLFRPFHRAGLKRADRYGLLYLIKIPNPLLLLLNSSYKSFSSSSSSNLMPFINFPISIRPTNSCYPRENLKRERIDLESYLQLIDVICTETERGLVRKKG